MLRLIALCLLLCLPHAAFAARVALVLGNGEYAHAKGLPNARNDAADIAAKLRENGFTVFDGYDVGRLDTLRVIDEFNRAIGPDDTALFYFAGHGLQIGAENWLMPVDAQQGDEIAITNTSIRLRTVLRGMELRAGNRIVILDACRNNPFLTAGASRSADGGASRGLSRVEAGVGSYIAFSTQPGNVALDGRGRNSPFTAALLRHLTTPDQDIHAVMRAVRADVVAASGGTQVPWENSSLIDPLFLVPTAAETDGRAGKRLSDAKTEAQIAAERRDNSADRTPAAKFDHMVSGLDPQGDGFLALRSAPNTDSTILLKLLEGTKLRVLEDNGKWRKVELENGQRGWAHGNWIKARADTRPEAAPPPAAGIGAPPVSIGAPPAIGGGTTPRSAERRKVAGEVCMSLGNGAALCASSALAPQKTNTYGVDNMLDGRLETAWIEAARGLGVGEYVALDLGSKATFREIDLINGYSKSASLHAKNSRIAILRVTASNGRSQDLRLRDTSAWQSHTLDGFEDVRWVKLEIVRAIRGLQWEDTAISELRLR